MIMFAIIQGLYILRQDEDEGESDEKRKPISKPRKTEPVGGYHRSGPVNKTEPSKYDTQKPKSGKKSRFDEDDIEDLW